MALLNRLCPDTVPKQSSAAMKQRSRKATGTGVDRGRRFTSIAMGVRISSTSMDAQLESNTLV